MSKLNFLYLLAIAIIFSCVDIDSDDNNFSENELSNVSDFDLTILFKYFDKSVNIFAEGSDIVIQADGVPGHKSPYFPKTVDLSNGGYYYWVDQNSDGVNDMWSDGDSEFRQNPNFVDFFPRAPNVILF